MSLVSCSYLFCIRKENNIDTYNEETIVTAEEEKTEPQKGFLKKHWKKLLVGAIGAGGMAVLLYYLRGTAITDRAPILEDICDKLNTDKPLNELANDAFRNVPIYTKENWPRKGGVYTLPDGMKHSIAKELEALSQGIELADNQSYRKDTICNRRKPLAA